MGLREIPGWWTYEGAGRVTQLERAWKPHTLSPILCSLHLLHLAFPELNPFITESQALLQYSYGEIAMLRTGC